MQTRDYETNDGQKKSRTEIIIDNLVLLDSKAAGTKDAAATTNGPAGEPSDHPDDLPSMTFSEEEISPGEIPF